MSTQPDARHSSTNPNSVRHHYNKSLEESVVKELPQHPDLVQSALLEASINSTARKRMAPPPDPTKAANTNIHHHTPTPSSLFPTRQSRSAALGLIKSIRERKREYKGDGEGTGESSNGMVANPEGKVGGKGMGESEVVMIGGVGDLEKIERIDPSSEYYEQGEEEGNDEGNDDDVEGNGDEEDDGGVQGDEEEIDDEADG